MNDAHTLAANDMNAAFLLLQMEFHEKESAAWTTAGGAAPSAFAYRAPALNARTRLVDLPWQLVHSALWHMLANLVLVLDSDDPECVHQARVGWRRLRGTLHLLRSLQELAEMPMAPAFEVAIASLGGLRDLDVARLEVLPRAAALTHAGHADEWKKLIKVLDRAAALERATLRRRLQSSLLGLAFWQQVLWLMALRDVSALSKDFHVEPAEWAHERIAHLHHRFERAIRHCQDKEGQHRARIWAKRLHYASEDLRGLLGHKGRKWLKQAQRVQTRLGAKRDWQMAAALAQQHGFHALVPHLLQSVATR